MRVTINGLCQNEKFIRQKYKRTEETLCYGISKSHSFTLIWHKFSVFTFQFSVYNIVWFWNKKHTIATSGILAGATDHHSHILPGVDDGVETMEEALRILDSYETLGIKELWLTPHIMEDIPNTPQKLSARFNELKAAYTGNITLHLAAEYMIDNHLRKLIQEINSPSLAKREYPKGEGVETNKLLHSLEGRWHELSEVTEGNQTNNCPSYVRGASDAVAEGVETNNLLPIGKKGDHLLVETSYFNPPMRLKETLRLIKSLGYHPLLAHPERYMYMEKEDYLELNEEGVKFQLNIISLAGGYGNTVKKKAEWLLANGLYSVAGSDLHCENAIEYITNCMLSKQSIEQVEKLLHNSI